MTTLDNQVKVKRTFPSRNSEDSNYMPLSNGMYDIYKMKKSELGKYLNTWLPGNQLKEGSEILIDEMWNVKRCDEETASQLYNEKINPIVIYIRKSDKFDVKKIELNNDKVKLTHSQLKKMKRQGIEISKSKEAPLPITMKHIMFASIQSIDDSSYSIGWENNDIETLIEIRTKLMRWINSQKVINGYKFFEHCIELGADESTKNFG